MNHPLLTRRELLRNSSLGFGGLALSGLYGAPVNPHFPARAKNVIFLFMEGGVSQVDSFDYKPLLAKHHGEDPRKAIGEIEATQFGNVGKVMKSPWEFKQRGQCGAWISDLFPHVAELADELAIIRSMTSNFPEHTSACYYLHSGLGLQGRPSMGAWASYGLGSENENFPGYVVLNGGQIPSGGLDNFSNGFLPATHRGNLLNAIGTPLANVKPNEKIAQAQEIKRRLAQQLNRGTAVGVEALESAIANHELAARMQLAIPEVMSLDGETEATKKLYGFDAEYKHTQTYARECLIARRLIERGVRFVELTIPMVNGYQRWDAHNDLVTNHSTNARAVDQPIAGLIRDLKSRGLLDETLVVWTGEFGRTPFAQGGKGRDHNEYGFSLWMAGGGVKPGVTFGATDEWGYRAVENPLQIHDLHATILHLLGINHEKLTYRFSGRDIRLTDVHGKIVKEILA
ncbi:DUF1501 domain-containing protein [Akkermansiaceae bacterium]|nr:DUF1501 domain-containing protein [Akkermansiaceae bacterium]MDA7898430.1 DUF1501 domain-containing protein [Akkermansiaceae bacterium]MDA8961052.1 DUF1501 domain-containing protein [Akkermansiaceae bacterium]MDB4472027.1 DUF1501 domain-containing protein [Akkermansiaceae bacterium]MDB4478129.1 DUF1501 domain-containing protein [Akkermansiaceae bacterium]